VRPVAAASLGILIGGAVAAYVLSSRGISGSGGSGGSGLPSLSQLEAEMENWNSELGIGSLGTGSSWMTGIPSLSTRTNLSVPNAALPYLKIFREASGMFNVPLSLLLAVAQQESAFNPNAVSSAGALGIMQFEPATAKVYEINPLDPAQAIPAAAHYLKNLYDQFGNWAEALAAYNWGPTNLAEAIRKYGNAWINNAPLQTQNYVTSIMKHSGVLS
jgi:soluble lytic murein transglycosylase-like protein